LKVYPNAIDIVMPALSPNEIYQLYCMKNQNKAVMNQYLIVFNKFYQNKKDEGIQYEDVYKANFSTPNAILTGAVAFEYYQKNKLKSIFDKYEGDTTKAAPELLKYLTDNREFKIQVNGKKQKAILFADVEEVGLMSTRQFSLQTSAALRLVADAGVIYTGFQEGFNAVTPYVGINFSFRSMDSDIPFKTLLKSKRIHWYDRFTLNAGVTLNSIAKTNFRTNLFGNNNNVMVGLGFKISHAVNLNAGGLLYYTLDSNPLFDNKTFAASPYVGISINLKIRDALGEIANIFKYGK
jgi:hypothetical protein